jgi:hypothetical protein
MRYGLLSLTLTLAAITPVSQDAKEEIKRKEIGKNVYLETQGDQRRVVVKASVCLREGQLEGLLCRKSTKEHEYILAFDGDARFIHAALLAARAEAGSPVQFEPKYQAASGSTIKVTLRYLKGDKAVTVPAREWILDGAAKKPLQTNWVFGGSRFLPDPNDRTREDIYLANQGDVICLCNMEGAMLDLPIRSPRKLEERTYQAVTDKIPEAGTPVEVILEVVADKKDK